MARFDIMVQTHGTVTFIVAKTDAARSWIRANMHIEDWGGSSVAVESRYLDDLLNSMSDGGLLVEN